MGEAGAPDVVDLLGLREDLRALDSAVRLQILWRLREPKRPGDLRVKATGDFDDLPSGRVLSRSTVSEHVGVLEEQGLVRRTEDGELVVDQQRMHSLVRDLSVLGRLEPIVRMDVEATMELDSRGGDPMPEGPKLILVNGPRVGDAFPLDAQGPWRIGRDPDVDVSLAYDPHVSRGHALVSRRDDGLYQLEALPGATNATLLDFEELPPGSPRTLMPGSVISVGASRLVFKAV